MLLSVRLCAARIARDFPRARRDTIVTQSGAAVRALPYVATSTGFTNCGKFLLSSDRRTNCFIDRQTSRRSQTSEHRSTRRSHHQSSGSLTGSIVCCCARRAGRPPAAAMKLPQLAGVDEREAARGAAVGAALACTPLLFVQVRACVRVSNARRGQRPAVQRAALASSRDQSSQPVQVLLQTALTFATPSLRTRLPLSFSGRPSLGSHIHLARHGSPSRSTRSCSSWASESTCPSVSSPIS